MTKQWSTSSVQVTVVLVHGRVPTQEVFLHFRASATEIQGDVTQLNGNLDTKREHLMKSQQHRSLHILGCTRCTDALC